jgi:hypothetical protein
MDKNYDEVKKSANSYREEMKKKMKHREIHKQKIINPQN